MSKYPTEVEHDRSNGRVVIRWNDGSQLQYPLDDLRNACPCAVCRGHGGTKVEPPKVHGVALLGIDEVGSYALRFQWSDGHDTGIYTWELLASVGQEMIV